MRLLLDQMSQRKSKGSRNANLQIRINRVVNGMGQAGPTSPVFILKGKRVIKLKRSEYDHLVAEADGLSYFAGHRISPEDIA